MQRILIDYMLDITLCEKQSKVYNTIKTAGGVANMAYIREQTGMQANSITPRLNELVGMGYLLKLEKEFCPITNKKTIFYKAMR